MFADMNAGGLGTDWVKCPTNFLGSLGLHIEALVLGQAAGKKDVNDRFGAARRIGFGPEPRQIAHAQAHQAQGTCMDGGAAIEWGVNSRFHNEIRRPNPPPVKWRSGNEWGVIPPSE